MVTMPEGDLITDIDQFLDRLPSLHQHRKTLAGILETVAVEDQAIVAKLWESVEAEAATQTPGVHTRREIAAQALANVANRYPEHFDDIDRCMQQVQTDDDRVVTSLLSLIESVWGDQPAVLEPHWSELMNHFDPEPSQARLRTLLELMLPMAIEYPDQVDTEDLHPLTTHDSVNIRTLVYDILGYAGPPTAYTQLKECAVVEDQAQAQHTIDHACTRLEVRFPDHVATE
jgi:hypothetical protein